MSARTILNPPLNTTLRNSVAQSVYTNFTPNETVSVEITFPLAYGQYDNVLYTIYSDQLTTCTYTLGDWVSNPTPSSTTVSYNVNCVTGGSTYLFGLATPY